MSVMNARIIAVALDEVSPPASAYRSMVLAQELASRAGATLLVVRIREESPSPQCERTRLPDVIRTAEQAFLGKIIVRHVEVSQQSLTSTPPGSPNGSQYSAGEAFVATAAGFGAGLLVVAMTAEREPLDGLVGGVVGAAEVPTVVVPAGVDHLSTWPFHVVVALDSVPRTGRVTEQIRELYGWFQTSLSLLHVVHPGGGRLDGVSALAADRAAHMLQRSATCLGACGVDPSRIHVVVRTGDASKVIVDHMRREHATLGVLPVVAVDPGHRRQHGVTADVLSASHVPIVLLHAADDHGASYVIDRNQVRGHTIEDRLRAPNNRASRSA